MGLHHEKTILDAAGGSHAYVVTLHPAEEGFELLDHIMEVTGGSAGQLTSGATWDMDSAVGSIGKILSELAMRVREKGNAQFLKQILKYAVRDGKKFSPAIAMSDAAWTFNSAYTGNYGEMAEAVQFILEVNFRSFFDWFGEKIGEKIDLLWGPAQLEQNESQSESE